MPGLQGLVAPAFAGFDLDITDNKRVDNWLPSSTSSNGQERCRSSQSSTCRTITRRDRRRRTDAARDDCRQRSRLGRVVETISNSAYWRDSAIFVVEDDAQSGPDHVDSHRSVLLIASPFAKRNFVDHTFYTTSGVLRTIELILGIEPMSQYDAAATPLFNAFTGTPNGGTYARALPRVALDEKNLAAAFGAMQSLAMDFSVEDRAPEVLLNEIIWRSMRGAHSPMPPPRRSAFVRPLSRTADDDDEH